jgi:dipeptidyl aminopeptidase/acylaminoacyl peptidase
MINLSTTDRLRRTTVAAAATCAGALALGMLAGMAPAGAANPGENGRIAFTFDQDPASLAAPADLKSINPNGSGIQILADTGKNQYPAYSPDGEQIAYTRDDGTLSTLYVANADGSQPRPLMPPVQNAVYGYPTWSPDGERIAYQFIDFAGTDRYNIKIIDVNRGTSQIPETFGDPTRSSLRPAWSPSGDRIAYSVISGTDNACPEILVSNLWVANVDGSGQPEQLTTGGCSKDYPDWSPDGRYIAFSSDLDRSSEEIYQLDTQDPGPLRKLTTGGYKDPAYSPDGQQIVATNVSGQSPAIYKMSADGSNPQNLGQQGEYPTWQPLNPPPPPPPPSDETTLTVDAKDKSKKLKVGKKAKLVKSATTNGEITKVKIVCKVDGKKYVNAKAKKPCGAKEKKKSNPDTARVVAKLKCDTKVKIKAIVTAQYQQTDPAKWKRTWKVKKNTGPNC